MNWANKNLSLKLSFPNRKSYGTFSLGETIKWWLNKRLCRWGLYPMRPRLERGCHEEDDRIDDFAKSAGGVHVRCAGGGPYAVAGVCGNW